MKILFFMNNYPDSRNGGIENVTRMLSEQFVKKGHVVHVRYLHDSVFAHSDDSIFNSCEQIDIENIREEISSVVKQYDIDIIVNRCVIFASPILKDAIKRSQCRLITTYNNKPTLSPPSIREVVLDSDTSWIKKILILLVYPLFAYRSRVRLKKRHRESYVSSDYTVLLSKQYISEYTDMMNITSEKLVVLNNPIKDELNLKPDDLENKENTILMVTRLDEKQKCIIKALKIWEKVYSDIMNWRLQIVGSGPDEILIKNFAQENKLKNVDFYAAQNPEEFYRKSSIFLMTSRNEGWPNTLNEAMRLGCAPVVIDTFSAVYDMIDNEKNGMIIQHGSEVKDVENCMNAILRLINNEKLLNRMALNACKKTKRLSIRIIAEQWMKLFEATLMT